MIRERREQDLERLGEVVSAVEREVERDVEREVERDVERGLERDAGRVVRGDPDRPARQWLQDFDAEWCWVFDQAPVSVAPTRNVIAHLAVYRPPPLPWSAELAEQLDRPIEQLSVIGRVFVRPGKHDYGVCRFLLRQAVQRIEQQGRVAVLDPVDLGVVSPVLIDRIGFVAVHLAGGSVGDVRVRIG